MSRQFRAFVGLVVLSIAYPIFFLMISLLIIMGIIYIHDEVGTLTFGDAVLLLVLFSLLFLSSVAFFKKAPKLLREALHPQKRKMANASRRDQTVRTVNGSNPWNDN